MREVIRQAVSSIRSRYSEPLTLSGLAAEAFVAPTTSRASSPVRPGDPRPVPVRGPVLRGETAAADDLPDGLQQRRPSRLHQRGHIHQQVHPSRRDVADTLPPPRGPQGDARDLPGVPASPGPRPDPAGEDRRGGEEAGRRSRRLRDRTAAFGGTRACPGRTLHRSHSAACPRRLPCRKRSRRRRDGHPERPRGPVDGHRGGLPGRNRPAPPPPRKFSKAGGGHPGTRHPGHRGCAT